MKAIDVIIIVLVSLFALWVIGSAIWRKKTGKDKGCGCGCGGCSGCAAKGSCSVAQDGQEEQESDTPTNEAEINE
jgi:hypothetical protein